MEQFYNEAQKQQFISYVEKTKDELCMRNQCTQARKDREIADVRNLFLLFAPTEQKYNRDFSQFGRTEMDELYNELLVNFKSSTLVRNTCLCRKYLSWCEKEGYITQFEYKNHPLKVKYNGNNNDGVLYRSTQFSDRYKAVAKKIDEEGGIDTDNYVFETEGRLIHYLDTVLHEERYLMTKVCLFLMYYGFPSQEIISIRKDEINEVSRTVRGVEITTDIAFMAILDAKYVQQYETQIGRVVNYVDSEYLIRTADLGKQSNNEGMVSVTFVKRSKSRLDAALSELSNTSVYKNIKILPSKLSAQHYFHIVRKDELEYGEDYVMEHLKYGAYNFKLSIADYKMMRLVAKDI